MKKVCLSLLLASMCSAPISAGLGSWLRPIYSLVPSANTDNAFRTLTLLTAGSVAYLGYDYLKEKQIRKNNIQKVETSAIKSFFNEQEGQALLQKNIEQTLNDNETFKQMKQSLSQQSRG